MSRRRVRRWTEGDLARMRAPHRSANAKRSVGEPGGILTLDLARATGWAYGGLDDYEPMVGVWHLDRTCLGAVVSSFENEMIDALEKFKPSRVVMEAPLSLPAQTQQATARQQYGLAAYCEGECHRARVTCFEESVDTVRKITIGRCRWPKREEIKPAIVAWCQNQGWSVTDHNAADAAVLWRFSCDLLRAEAHAKAALSIRL